MRETPKFYRIPPSSGGGREVGEASLPTVSSLPDEIVEHIIRKIEETDTEEYDHHTCYNKYVIGRLELCEIAIPSDMPFGETVELITSGLKSYGFRELSRQEYEEIYDCTSPSALYFKLPNDTYDPYTLLEVDFDELWRDVVVIYAYRIYKTLRWD